MKSRIVIIDDEVKLLKALKKALDLEGYEVFDFSDPTVGLEFITKRDIDLVISDIRMSGMTGIKLLGRIKQIKPNLNCILMTAFSSVETAVTAVKLGASDYLLKPFELADFKNSVRQVLKNRPKADITSNKKELVGHSVAMRQVHEVVESISDTCSTVLIYGESGTGKELIARAIHHSSRRQEKPFVAVNCSAIPEQLFESEMFGHKKGSFTSAYEDKSGLFKEAEGGTLFLDEIGDLPLSCQAKLLRVLQDGIFKPVGSTQQLKSDVRIIAASNRMLRKEASAGNFREDLLYRINVVEIELPPLRQRREDIRELAEFFMKYYSARHNRKISGGSHDFFEALRNYEWPGNIRQLENCIERAVILKRSGELVVADLSLPDEHNIDNIVQFDSAQPLTETINRIEENIILQALETADWNYSRAAAILGLTRQSLHYKLKKYGISKEL